MPQILTAIGTDATNSFEDLSGITCINKKLRARSNNSNRRLPATGIVSTDKSRGVILKGGERTSDLAGRISQKVGMFNRRGAQAGGVSIEDGTGGEEEDSEAISNPYDVLIEGCEHDPQLIQNAYQRHRLTRNSLQRDKIFAPGFPGVTVDKILRHLVRISPSREHLVEKEEIDPRHCLVFWARPPDKIKTLVSEVQRKLVEGIQDLDIGDLWLMPPHCLHMTVLEVTHSTTSGVVSSLIEKLTVPFCQRMVSYPKTKQARLVKPMLSFDAAALAISFLPEEKRGRDGDGEEAYTYHHLRRDLYRMCEETGINIDSRYIVPSAHITIGRFISTGASTGGVAAREKMRKYVDTIEDINRWLEVEYEMDGNDDEQRYEWAISKVVLNRGRLWYGGGETVACSDQ